MILLLAALTAGAAFAFSRMQTPVYEATARLLITSRPDFGQTQAARELRQDFATYLYSSLRAQDVISELQLDMTPTDLLADAEIAASTSENVVQVRVESTDPDLAKQIARTWAEQLIAWRRVENANFPREDRIKAELLDNPTVGLDRPQTRVNVAAGAVFGALLGILLVFILEWIESGIVRRPDDVERYLEIPVIGTIPEQRA